MSLKYLTRFFSWSHWRDSLKGVDKRQLQQQVDTHKLFLYTSLQQEYRRTAGRLPEGTAEQLVTEVRS
jgi:hypothetical protein